MDRDRDQLVKEYDELPAITSPRKSFFYKTNAPYYNN